LAHPPSRRDCAEPLSRDVCREPITRPTFRSRVWRIEPCLRACIPGLSPGELGAARPGSTRAADRLAEDCPGEDWLWSRGAALCPSRAGPGREATLPSRAHPSESLFHRIDRPTLLGARPISPLLSSFAGQTEPNRPMTAVNTCPHAASQKLEPQVHEAALLRMYITPGR